VQRGMDAPSLGTLGATARAVVQELLVGGPLPRAELARRLDLSPASLTKASRELILAGILRDSVSEERQPVGGESPGRPGTPVMVTAETLLFIGLKVTGDDVFAVRADAVGRVQRAARRDLPDRAVASVERLIVDLVKELAAGQVIQAVGIGLAGAMSRFDDRVRRNIYLDWDGVPLAAVVEDATGIRTVISGDVRALTAGVQWWGPARGWRDFAVLTVGVGVGVGIVLGGEVGSGPRGTAGSVAHTRVDDSGPLCDQGHRGCAAAFLDAASITRGAGLPHGRADLTLDEVCALARADDPVARRVLADAGQALGALVADLVNLLDLPAVVLAGDGLGIVEHARPAMEAALADRLDRGVASPQIRVFESDFDEWARGAATVACQWLLLSPAARVRPVRRDLAERAPSAPVPGSSPVVPRVRPVTTAVP
jgi:predicted NBD/HSP70 family sugar kinase